MSVVAIFQHVGRIMQLLLQADGILPPRLQKLRKSKLLPGRSRLVLSKVNLDDNISALFRYDVNPGFRADFCLPVKSA